MNYWCMCFMIVSAIVLKSSADNDITLKIYENNNDGLGNSNFKYTLSDGTSREESVKVVDKDTENENLVIQGMYSIIHGGIMYKASYVADVNGYRPKVEITAVSIENRFPTAGIMTLAGGGVG